MQQINLNIWDIVTQNNIPCFDHFLLLRPNAIKTKSIIKNYIFTKLTDDPHIILKYDFSLIDSMDISFADEIIFLLKLDLQLYDKYQFIIVLVSSGINFTNELLPTITAAQMNREKIETAKLLNKKNLYLPVLIYEHNSLSVLGEFEKKLQDIYANSFTNKAMTTRELSESLNISLTNAGTQANNLLNLGLIFKKSENGPNGKFNTYFKIDSTHITQSEVK
ncbi:MAG: hypothetical protein K0S47_581 [Herbinix sp.]|jgi:hypothetical protein|nr:hypothetical protein [Herbinix sp.]